MGLLDPKSGSGFAIQIRIKEAKNGRKIEKKNRG
jgi:hypothetical protein